MGIYEGRINMKNICLEDQYYNDFVQKKTSQPLVVVNWSKVKETLSDVAYGIMSVMVIVLLVLIGTIY